MSPYSFDGSGKLLVFLPCLNGMNETARYLVISAYFNSILYDEMKAFFLGAPQRVCKLQQSTQILFCWASATSRSKNSRSADLIIAGNVTAVSDKRCH